MMTKRRVLIVEPNPAGHRLVYVRLLVREILRREGTAVVALEAGAQDTREFALHMADLSGNIEWTTVSRKLVLRRIGRLARSARADQVIVPDGDLVASRLGLLRWWTPPVPATLVVMRDPRSEPRTTWTRNLKLKLKAHLLKLAQTRDQVRLVWLRPPGDVRSDEAFANDPVQMHATTGEANEFRRQHGMSSDRYWFGMVGGISQRKNLPLVLQAMSSQPSNLVGFGIFGPVDPLIREQTRLLFDRLRDAGVGIVVVDTLHTDDEMGLAVKALDCVVVAYSSHAPPSTLGKAAAAGTQVLAAGSPSIEQIVDSLGRGQWIWCSKLSPRELAIGMEQARKADPIAPREDLGVDGFLSAVLCQ